MSELKEQQKQWLTALEGDDYEQCQEKLKDGESYCCLGVAMELFGDGEWRSNAGTTDWFPRNGNADQYWESYMPDRDWQGLGLWSNSGELVIPDDEPDSAVHIVFVGDGTDIQSIQLFDEANSADMIDRGFVLSRVENLAELNDQGCSFQEIAKFAREHPEIVFDLPEPTVEFVVELDDEVVTAIIDEAEGAS